MTKLAKNNFYFIKKIKRNCRKCFYYENQID